MTTQISEATLRVQGAARSEITRRLSRGLRQATTATREAVGGLPQFAARDLALATDSLSSAMWLMERHDVGSSGRFDDDFALVTQRIAEAAAQLARISATN